MKQFTYNPDTLTDEQKMAIANIENDCEKGLKDLQEQENRRAQNYYDCIDDYSWGGLCSRANMLAQDRERAVRDIRIEEVVRGGYHLRERKVNILRRVEDNECVAIGLHQGKFGPFFRTNDGQFVSYAKKVSTYEKKGYRPFVRTIIEKRKYNGFWMKSGDIRCDIIDTAITSEELSTEYCVY